MENYEKICDIGKGSFGMVSKIKRKSDGKVLVWKELNYGKMSEKEKQQLVSEVNILRELRHPHIVRYYDRIIDKEKTKIFIIQEFCEEGDVSLLIKKQKKKSEFLPESLIWKVLAQMTHALYECHKRKDGKILHRDLKPGNVFLDSKLNVKLGDFGLSRMMGDQSIYAYTHVGTPYYMSPEQISEQRYNDKSDIWSAGCVIYELAALRAPFEATNQIQLAMKIKSGVIERIPRQYSEQLFKVIQWMLSLEKEKRPSVEELMVHPQICYHLREKKIKEMDTNIKRKAQDIDKKDKTLKEREIQIEKQLKELEEQEQKLTEWENKLKKRQAMIGGLSTPKHNKLAIVEDSPKIVARARLPEREEAPNSSRQQMKRVGATSQSRDCLPTSSRDKPRLESGGRAKDIYRSNDNFQPTKYQKPTIGSYHNKYEEEKKDNYIPSYRRGLYTKEQAHEKKPPMIRQAQTNYNDKFYKPREEHNGENNIEYQRKKLAALRQGYVSSGEQRHSRQNSRDRQTNLYSNNSNSAQNFHQRQTYLKGRNDYSSERQSKEYMPMRRQSSSNQGSSKNLRNALEEITQKIQNKYLS